MNRALAGALICLLGGPLNAACRSAGSQPLPAPAVLTGYTVQCRAQIEDAVHELRGQAVALGADAFTQNDAVVLSTVGRSASGRMMPPTEILRLQLAPSGCQLRLDAGERTVALPRCSCRAAAAD